MITRSAFSPSLSPRALTWDFGCVSKVAIVVLLYSSQCNAFLLMTSRWTTILEAGVASSVGCASPVLQSWPSTAASVARYFCIISGHVHGNSAVPGLAIYVASEHWLYPSNTGRAHLTLLATCPRLYRKPRDFLRTSRSTGSTSHVV